MAFGDREALPYGLRDIKIAKMTGTTRGTLVDLPNAQTLSFSSTEEFEVLRGDDRDVATRGRGGKGSFELEAGGLSFEAWAVLDGGTISSSGTTPAIKKKYTKKTTDQRPEFYAEGQSMSESGGDFHAMLYRCKCTDDLEGELADGTWFITQTGGSMMGSLETGKEDILYELVNNETAAAIA